MRGGARRYEAGMGSFPDEMKNASLDEKKRYVELLMKMGV